MRDLLADDDELDLVSMLKSVWPYRLLLLGTSILGALIGLYIALTAVSMFRAETVITEVTDSGMSTAGSLANRLGAVASLAGVDIGGGTAASQEHQAVLRSRHLAEEFIKPAERMKELLQDQEEPQSLWFAVKRFRENVLSIRDDKRNGTTTIAMRWTDPATAARWANEYVALANEMIRARAIEEATRNIAYLSAEAAKTNVVELQRVMFGLVESETKKLMLANGRTEFAFTVVDPAVKPEVRVSPLRSVIVLVATFLGFIAGGLIAFVHHAFSRSRRLPSPEAQ